MRAQRRMNTLRSCIWHRYWAVADHQWLSRRDARELVSELEFVWDQIKSNVPSSSSSSPLRNLSGSLEQHRPSLDRRPSGVLGESSPHAPLRVLSPVSQPDGAEDDLQKVLQDVNEGEYDERNDNGGDQGASLRPASSEARDSRWRRRVEKAMVKMTAEVAALREQMESRRIYDARRRRSLWAWLVWLVWITIRHLLVDAVVLGVILLWMRRRKDNRLELAGLVWDGNVDD
ncbi:MAG: hypothetical protein M1837_001571 [Sclerophora amabilis]|nr:MAG: hypothetical protein M1837_001571 [Sclerophora amabilis]